MASDEIQTPGRKRLLLLMTPATYRAGAYFDAAQNLDIEVIRGLDLPKALAEEWGVQLALDFADIESSVATLKEAHARQPFDAIVPVDDSATILAARANAALGLPWNPPEAAEAARDKGVMRRLMAAAGVPSPGLPPLPPGHRPARDRAAGDYPCVVKPLRLSGSRGVIRANIARRTRRRRRPAGAHPARRRQHPRDHRYPGRRLHPRRRGRAGWAAARGWAARAGDLR